MTSYLYFFSLSLFANACMFGMGVRVHVRYILFTFHLLYILIYLNSILFHSVPFSISFNVATGSAALLLLLLLQSRIILYTVFFTILFSFSMNKKREIISVVLVETGCVTGAGARHCLLLLLLNLFLSLSVFRFTQMNIYLFHTVVYVFCFWNGKKYHEKSSEMLFKPYILCFILVFSPTVSVTSNEVPKLHTETYNIKKSMDPLLSLIFSLFLYGLKRVI